MGDEQGPVEPRMFRFYAGGEEYMLMKDVAKYHNRPPSSIYAEYPSLYRRQATIFERGVLESHKIANMPIVTFVRASEVSAIGNKDELAELLKDPPQRWEQFVPESGRAVVATQSCHVPPLPMRPVLVGHPMRPRNPLAPYYRYADGLASPSDSMSEVLVPVRINIENDSVKYRDTFTWNVNDTTIKPLVFAEMLCQDMELPPGTAALIATSIEQQLEEFASLQEIQANTRPVTINLELPFGEKLLKDRFVWDPNEPLNNPEDFAAALCQDLGLGGEYIPTVAFAIREQLHLDRKAIISDDMPMVENPNMPRHVGDLFRVADAEDWCPAVVVLSQSERERKMQDGERESRWRRRAAKDMGDRGRASRAAAKAGKTKGRVRIEEQVRPSVAIPAAPTAVLGSLPPAVPLVLPAPLATQLAPTAGPLAAPASNTSEPHSSSSSSSSTVLSFASVPMETALFHPVLPAVARPAPLPDEDLASASLLSTVSRHYRGHQTHRVPATAPLGYMRSGPRANPIPGTAVATVVPGAARVGGVGAGYGGAHAAGIRPGVGVGGVGVPYGRTVPIPVAAAAAMGGVPGVGIPIAATAVGMVAVDVSMDMDYDDGEGMEGDMGMGGGVNGAEGSGAGAGAGGGASDGAQAAALSGSRFAFTAQVVNYMKTWLREKMLRNPPNQGIPHVTDEEKAEIAVHTNLTTRQISQWFQNRRKDYANSLRNNTNFLNNLLVTDPNEKVQRAKTGGEA